MSIPAARFDIELDVRLIPEDSNIEFHGVSKNMSETGVLVLTERQEPRGTRLGLEFPVFKGKGEVIWTRETEKADALLGMKFVSLSRKDRKSLLSLLKGPGTET